MPEMKTLTCPGPPEHEFQIPKGRGRPPKYCDQHKGQSQNGNGEPREEGKKVEAATPRARPRPRATTSNENQEKQDEPQTNRARPRPERHVSPPGSSPDVGSRVKAQSAAERTDSQNEDVWPRGIAGRPMARIEYSAAELVPTGDYANVSVGPARITAFIDLDREVGDGERYFEPREVDVLIKASNELAALVEHDVIAIQRSIVLESLQDQVSANGK